MGMDLVGHQAVVAHIGVVPKRGRDVQLVIRGRMDRAILGIHHAPAALSLHPAHFSQGAGTDPAHAGAMRHLVEAIFRRHRANADRLEQDVITGVKIHAPGPFNHQSRATAGNSRSYVNDIAVSGLVPHGALYMTFSL